DVLSYHWKQEQRINILEVTAFLAELRRRTGDPSEHGKRFFNILDSLVSFYVLFKGRSSSGRLNRLCRRVTAVNIAAAVLPISLWTISKWNFYDDALPRNLVELDEELAEYINICFRKEITSPWAVGQLVGCGASFRRAAFILQLLSSSTGTGAGYISRNAPLRCRGWVPKLWRRQPFESIGTMASFRTSFAALVRSIGLDPVDYLPYCLRRGGATHFYQQTQLLGRTMVQGRWKDQLTARMYVDDARATLIQLQLPAHVSTLQRCLASWRVASQG
ncbi:mmpL11, partial [Symbiodinium pilosum]